MGVKLKALRDQVVVITGASSGIGLATARQAAAQGAKVVLASRNGEALAKIEADIKAKGGTAIHVVADVAKRDDVEKLAAKAIEAYGHFDTWVNNAAVGIFGRLDEVSDEDSRQLFDINFWGLVYGTNAAASHLREHGGAIINLGSIVSDIGFPIQGMYGASKHAVKGFTDAFRMEQELAGAPISMTLIKPASINTPFPAHAKNIMGGTPTLPPPVYAPEDVAAAILHAAVHGGRDYYIGGGGKLMSSLNKRLPRLVDRLGEAVIPGMSKIDAPSPYDPAGTLYKAGADGRVHGDSKRLVMRSAYTKASMHPLAAGAAAACAGLMVAAILGRNDRG